LIQFLMLYFSCGRLEPGIRSNIADTKASTLMVRHGQK
jgi:hypothetical protein